jgi:glutamate-5-semialdehyde dehydrogenase
MIETSEEFYERCSKTKQASKRLGYLDTKTKNKALENIAQDLLEKKDIVLSANKIDIERAASSGMSPAMLDRLVLNEERLRAMSQDTLAVASLPDPVGEFFDVRTLPNGLIAGKKRIPLGVIAAIYESRPNVTIDVISLCLKSGNSTILRGGSEAINSNLALASLAREAISQAGIDEDNIQFIENTDRALVNKLLKMSDIIDLVIPRGGAGLIRFVKENATMPVITGGIGVCHTYVDKLADIDKAVAIAYNAKVQRPTVCNALDTLIVHKDIAEDYLPAIARKWAEAGVEMRCDPTALEILKPIKGIKVIPTMPDDWGKEFLALVAAIKVVSSLDEAITHIERYGSGHSEAIVTEDYAAAKRFLNEVDAACVYVNASTRFTDGGQLGLGAEIGISTQKMHARGPMGLRELTSYKWIVLGSGQVRP